MKKLGLILTGILIFFIVFGVSIAKEEELKSLMKSIVEKVNTNNDGLYQRSFAVVRNSRALSILIETAYVINPYDNVLLNSEKFQKNCAKAISNGVIEYLKNTQVK